MKIDIKLSYPEEIIAQMSIEMTVKEMKDFRGQLQNIKPSSEISTLLDTILNKVDTHFTESDVSSETKPVKEGF